ncbi:hypothetical protein [Syntrophorhabdus aromaticivorans]|uniref:hypothetical protein n=1 Tax=Syntrophorhabdus aromaticivorans TaxID=328301 RepID=UPI0003FFA7D6|nr:hypothetical protein [Syntrophorhabdus aromaticivorans]
MIQWSPGSRGPYSIHAREGRVAAPGRLIATISILGAILTGIGIIFIFVASNRSQIRRWGTLSISR